MFVRLALNTKHTGVHSIERSAQEDMLLVLFNAAISNLVKLYYDMKRTPTDICNLQVLFRNNFALSRDITGLFQSFQSSSSNFLDPEANKGLFNSQLVVIIKVHTFSTFFSSGLISVTGRHRF